MLEFHICTAETFDRFCVTAASVAAAEAVATTAAISRIVMKETL